MATLKFTAILTAAGVALMLALPARAAECADMTPGVNPLTVTSGGREYGLNLVLPVSLKPGQRVPLVIGLHPSGGSGASFDQDTGLTAAATAKGFAVMFPDGGVELKSAAGASAHYWNIPGVPLVTGDAVPGNTRDDVRFIADAIDHVVKHSCVDGKRIYVTGFSGGARMTSMVGCRLADRLAAVAPVAGLRAGRAAGPGFSEPDADDCRPLRPLPVLAIHGTADSTNPFPGGGGLRWGYSVERATARWASLDSCSVAPAVEKVSAQVTRVRYSACGAGSEVALYEINAREAEGGGHVWPGGQRDLANRAPPAYLDATQLVLQFFARH
ncbi:MAG: PHB depolymerase family esterase [Pseudomonadota bacterium]